MMLQRFGGSRRLAAVQPHAASGRRLADRRLYVPVGRHQVELHNSTPDDVPPGFIPDPDVTMSEPHDDALQPGGRKQHDRRAVQVREPAGLIDPVAQRRLRFELEGEGSFKLAHRQPEAVQFSFDRYLSGGRVEQDEFHIRGLRLKNHYLRRNRK
jgi:hypothetical protein